MATPGRNTVKVFVYIGGQIVYDGLSVNYDQSHHTVVRVKRDISFSDFLAKIYSRCRIDRNEFVLSVSGKISRWYQNQWSEIVYEITSDDDIEIYLHPDEGNDSIDVYVESQPLYNPLMPSQFTTSEPLYSPSRPSQFSTSEPLYSPSRPSQFTTSEPLYSPSRPSQHFDLNDAYNSFMQTSPELVAVTQGFSNMGFEAGPSRHSYQNLGVHIGDSSGMRNAHENFDLPNETRHCDNNDDDDPFGDAHGPNVRSDSEPSDHGDDDDSGEENNDENIEAVDDVVQTISQPEIPSTSHVHFSNPSFAEPPTQFYDPPSFYSLSFPEIPADSIDVPSGMWSKFYDSSKGTLEKGMIF
ncbi:PREDICTED: DNA-directed RNA polymerase II subunit RPB1-like [Erythranthe guttata]|uniref:DNA-directed RNA polymerase II subunit RPB1-like n=1 Tax=Erythranthe guttata TaxID=4155 RepID=UPI00064D98C0|nr:PREDICTED: DNA-directed RNA polymerase II subunit RPB1-like [Erythranthe guttata]|eukprot:XP_012834001.1 PREDICTED: DNA-directed RNA polymerase II subunit RPB1-like [Erythranthe guttata]